MKKIFTIAHIVLVVYAIIHLVTQFHITNAFKELIQLEADPYLISVFNLLGLFPLAFLLFGLRYMNMTKPTWIGLSLGFMLGGFALIIPFTRQELKKNTVSSKVHIIALVGLIGAILTIGYGLILGNFSNYMSAFTSDSFVHIMTIDFLFLYGLSILLSFKVYKQPWFSMIPVIGFFYLIFQDVD
ncbi:hypothetical protein N7603_04535 [Acholeplasma vituli]|uniref:DUF998 domain-containing protein n=1 Tax=Paracholeplasma vituli TaxID=69473 RepID=A0ABT2PZ26_9MOLU|nr:hypothetical protein [Paracholeplasma vituli]MCU0104918.1 hypothetical protein [Paracholeplasma vituli]